MNAELLSFVRTADLEEMGPLFEVLVKRLYQHRKSNPKGYVPKMLFEFCIGMAGMSVSVQIVNEVVDDDRNHIGFALRKRDETEAGEEWAGLYHSTCTTGLMPDTPAGMLARDTMETFGKIPREDSIEFLGVTIHDEPERWSSCLTVMHMRKVTRAQVAEFVGEWKIFTDINSLEIIDHNRHLLQWVSDPNRPCFADIRGGWKK